MSLTLSEAIRVFILADGTLAAKLGTAVYPDVVPQSPPDCVAVTRVVSNVSWQKLDGATDQCATRIEVTFWCKVNRDAEVLCNRLRTIAKGFNGTMGASGIDLAVHQTMTRSIAQHPVNRYYGHQLDILAIVDMSTAA